MIEIYTDGSCLKNPDGPGGWAFCYIPEIEIENENKRVIIVSNGDKSTTNNRMELTAVIEALRFIGNDLINEYKIYTDSQLTIKCATGVWKRNKNLDLWKLYDKYSKGIKFNFEWVKGHSGNTYNELVDQAAYKEAKKVEKS